MAYTDNNKLTVNGRIVKDAELKTIKDDFGEIKFSLCCNTAIKKDGQWTTKPNYFVVKYKGTNLSKFCSTLLKGKQISVEGMLLQDSWEKDGQKNSLVYIQAENIQTFNTAPANETPQDVSTESFPEDDFGPDGIPF